MTADPAAIRQALLAWYAAEKRQLPWRGTRDPYRIWVSEVMLQQTTYRAVLPRYDAFLERFPNVTALADASEESVLAAWSGLGYYARARNLRKAAREIVSRYGGQIPEDPLLLEQLPGFGRYTAAAVAALAYDVRVPAAEANVTRILSRVHAIGGRMGTRDHQRAVVARVAGLLPDRRPGDLIAALMDLGQKICTARDPACWECPIDFACGAFRAGTPEKFPERPLPVPYVRVHVAAAVVEARGRALLFRSGAPWLAGLWQFPSAEAPTPSAARMRLFRRARRSGWRLAGPPRAVVGHTIVRRRLAIEVYAGRVCEERIPATRSELERWFESAALESAAIPTLTRKIGRAAGFLPG